MLAACAARRWLARSAAGIKLNRSQTYAAASACTSLVSCLPALEDIQLHTRAPVVREDLGCLLEALAWCSRLRALDLDMDPNELRAECADVYLPSLRLPLQS